MSESYAPEPYPLEDAIATMLGESVDPVAAGMSLRELAEQAPGRATELLDELVRQAYQLPASDPAIVGGLLRLLHTVLLQSGPDAIAALDPTPLRTIEQSLPAGVPNGSLLQHLYAMIRSPQSLGWLVESLRESPPDHWMAAAQVLSPLMQHDDWPIDAVYPEALDCLQYRALAAPLLDLANYQLRCSRIDRHPAADRVSMLNSLLGEVSHRLARFEEDPRALGDDVDTVQARLGEAVALAVSLCDAVGLIGDSSSIGKLNQAVELRHRRVQCEAAGALARLGEDEGKKRLLELTKEPSARLRSIHYADELGFGDLVEDSYRSDEATSEAEMALWLSQPQQMGVPPTDVEVVDSRRLLWPSFTDPIDVILVRFEYNFGDRTFSNVGVTGPVTFALSADVANLPLDDIYAIYAGWHAEHPEIFTVASEGFNEAQKRLMAVLDKYLDLQGYQSRDAKLLGFFLEEHAGVFQAVRDDTQCVVVTDGLETIDQPISGRQRPITPEDIFNLYKGRKMLRTFNPGA